MRLFLYGTLRDDGLFARVAGPGDGASGAPAWLDGHAVERVEGSLLPMLVPRKGARAEGVVWQGLTAAQRERLDLYELPFGYRLAPVRVGTAGGEVPALVYLPPQRQVPSGEPWTLARWQDEDGGAALLAAAELDLHQSRLGGDDLLRQWPMIRMRAEAQVRAGRSRAPSAVRRDPAPGDWRWEPAGPLTGAFFKLAPMRVDHRRFDGGQETALAREVLVGVDAALLLPYDPVRDRVLLVEQFRTGPARRGERNPWMLEPVAGIVDAGEPPEAAARREAAEEAGVLPRAVERMFSFYPSPGSSTDHFHCYLGLCDLPDAHAAHGGLAEEAEDLRLHLMARGRAMALIASGEIMTGPLIAMLYWLDREAARLRASAGG